MDGGEGKKVFAEDDEGFVACRAAFRRRFYSKKCLATKTRPNTHFLSPSLVPRMYSSIGTPPTSSESHQNPYKYHSNAFNIHTTASAATTGAAVAAKTNGSVNSIIRPSADAHTTTFGNNNSNSRNKCSYGAYNSTCSNNNFENVKQNIRTTTFNEKM
jgi:hypothetical protein